MSNLETRLRKLEARHPQAAEGPPPPTILRGPRLTRREWIIATAGKRDPETQARLLAGTTR